MSSKLLTLLLVFLGSILGVVGDFFIKSAGMNSRVDWKLIVVGSIIWLSTIPAWFYAFRSEKLGALGALYSLFTVIILVFVGAIYFHESLSATEWVGIALTVAALGLLSRFL